MRAFLSGSYLLSVFSYRRNGELPPLRALIPPWGPHPHDLIESNYFSTVPSHPQIPSYGGRDLHFGEAQSIHTSLNKMQVRRFLPVLSDAVWPEGPQRETWTSLAYTWVLHVAKKPLQSEDFWFKPDLYNSLPSLFSSFLIESGGLLNPMFAIQAWAPKLSDTLQSHG